MKDFLDTLTPGVIPRASFIQWGKIEEKLSHLAIPVELYSELAKRALGREDLVKELADSLLACDDPFPYVQCAFELLGHTGADLVTTQDDVDIILQTDAIGAGIAQAALDLAEVLFALGLDKVLARDNLKDVLFGVQVGLETHRRKNIGGQHFKNEIRSLLDEIAAGMEGRVVIAEEETIVYGSQLSKRVDFAIKVDFRTRFGVEVNFYTATGSKPTEIKRSYGDIRRGLADVGVDLIWITDGRGYRDMRRSLRDAYVILPNIYNYRQAKKHLASDLAAVLSFEAP